MAKITFNNVVDETVKEYIDNLQWLLDKLNIENGELRAQLKGKEGERVKMSQANWTLAGENAALRNSIRKLEVKVDVLEQANESYKRAAAKYLTFWERIFGVR